MELADGVCLDPNGFYQRFAHKIPPLTVVAYKVLNIPPSAAACERVNSACGANWMARRARLHVGRVALMVYVYHNARVLDRAQRAAAGPSWEEWFDWLDSLPPLERDADGRIIEEAGEQEAGGSDVADMEVIE